MSELRVPGRIAVPLRNANWLEPKSPKDKIAMTVPLPDELRNIVTTHPGEPLELIDERTHAAYLLVRADDFRRLTAGSEDDVGDSYVAQIASAMRAGWDDPRMDLYDDYDAHREQS